MRKSKIKGLPLAAKFILFISLLIILNSVILTRAFLRTQAEQLRMALKDKGQTLGKNLAYNSEYGVLIGNKEILSTLIKGIMREKDVIYCLIQDKEGEVLAFDSTPEGKKIYEEIKKVTPKGVKREKSQVKFYRSKKGASIYDIICSIRTKELKTEREEIGLAPVTPKTIEKTIGIARIGISLASVNHQINMLKKRAIDLTLLVIIIGILITSLLVRIIVKPIKKLILGTQMIAKGDLSYRVEIKSKDEIGELANFFNQMTIELKKSQDKIQEYNKTLEQKVEERTRQLKEVQAQLVQSAKMAAVGQLGAGVAHELNNPLAGILGYAQFILEKLKKPDFGIDDFKACSKYIETIEREATRCKKIVENLLKFSRKPPHFKPEPLDIKRVIEETLSIVGHQLKLKNIKVITDFKPNLVKVMGIPNELQQVFTNLILNAQQAMPEGGELKITLQNILDETTQKPQGVKIEFADTGCGISKENLPRIFEPFFTTRQKEKGTGLGLAISYQIIQEHKGNITVESEVGKGTVFTITLPAAG